jgi:hypothetical protein
VSLRQCVAKTARGTRGLAGLFQCAYREPAAQPSAFTLWPSGPLREQSACRSPTSSKAHGVAISDSEVTEDSADQCRDYAPNDRFHESAARARGSRSTLMGTPEIDCHISACRRGLMV